MNRLAVTALFTCTSIATGQITVGPVGSGATFSAIQDAVNAAPVGSTILVAPGSYEPFVVTRGVSIVGSGSDRSSLAIPAGVTEGHIDVTAVPSGETVSISGFTLEATSTSADGRIEVTDCDGRVELIDLVSEHPWFTGVIYYVDEPTMRIENSATVLVDDCRLVGSRPPISADWNPASGALLIDGSSVWLQGTYLRGGSGAEGNGSEALNVLNGSFVHISQSVLEGGSGGAHFGFYWWDIYGYSGEEGLSASDSTIVVAGGVDARIEGAAGFQLSSTDWTGGASAVQLLGTASFFSAPDVTLISGENGDGSPYGGPDVAQAGGMTQVSFESEARPTLGFESPSMTLGSTNTLRCGGRPGSTQLLFFDFDAVAPLVFPNGRSIHLNPQTAITLGPIALDGTGAANIPLNVPNNPALAGLELVLQSIDADLTLLRPSNPALAVIQP